MVWAGYNIGYDFGIFRIGHTGLEYPDHRRGPIAKAAQTNRFSQDGWIFLKGGRPESIGQNDHASSVGTIILRSDQTAKHGMKSHHIEVRASYYSGLHLTWLAQSDHGETDG